MVHHLWPPGYRFIFNCNCNWSSIVLKNGDGTANIIHSSEGVTQGEPFNMVAYGIGVFSLIKQLKAASRDITQHL